MTTKEKVMTLEEEIKEYSTVVSILQTFIIDLSENLQPSHSKPSPHFLEIPKSI